MERKRDGFVPIGNVVAGVELPDGRTLTPSAPQARHHFTTLRQVDQLIGPTPKPMLYPERRIWSSASSASPLMTPFKC